MTIDRHVMTTGDAARVLGLSVDRVKDLDDELKPIRLDSNHRRYDPVRVRRYAAKRARAVREARQKHETPHRDQRYGARRGDADDQPRGELDRCIHVYHTSLTPEEIVWTPSRQSALAR